MNHKGDKISYANLFSNSAYYESSRNMVVFISTSFVHEHLRNVSNIPGVESKAIFAVFDTDVWNKKYEGLGPTVKCFSGLTSRTATYFEIRGL